MALDRRNLLAGAAAAPLLGTFAGRSARAQAANTVKIGVLNDMSGLYRDIGGPGSVVCVRQAIQDLGNKGFQVEVVSADHQNKPDVGASIARQWFDQEGVDVIIDVPTSSVALAISGVAREKDKIFLGSNPATSDLTGAQCSPNTIQWTYDTWMLARSTGGAMVKAGGDTWFFLTAGLCVRPRPGARHRELREGAGRQGARPGAHAVPRQHRLLRLPAPSPGQPREGDRLGQCRRRYHHHHQAGGGVRHHPGRHQARGAPDVHLRRPRSRPEDRLGAGVQRHVLLGPERPHPRLHQARAAGHAEQLASGHGAKPAATPPHCTT